MMVLLIALLHALPVLWAGAQGMQRLPFWLLCAAMVGIAFEFGSPDDVPYDVAAIAVAALLMRPASRRPLPPAKRATAFRPESSRIPRERSSLGLAVTLTLAAVLLCAIGAAINEEMHRGNLPAGRLDAAGGATNPSGTQGARASRAGRDTPADQGRHAAWQGASLPRGDLRGCLDLGSTAAIAACANGSR